jgi:hypothetical protein
MRFPTLKNAINKFRFQTHLDNSRFPYKVAESIDDAPSIYVYPIHSTFSYDNTKVAHLANNNF